MKIKLKTSIITRFILFTGLFILTTSSSSYRKIDFSKGKNNNVCKNLTGDVLVYFVFVDTKTTMVWTEFDIQSTIDSMEIAIQWLKDQARKSGFPINIRSDYYIGNEFTTVNKSLPEKTLLESVETEGVKAGIKALNKWGDYIARMVGEEANIKAKDGIPEIKSPRNKERLIAHLRDEKQVESVALVYLVNNYFRNDISICINHLDTEDVEFAIVSYKYPSVIAQNILTLFGAADLSESIYRKNEKNIRFAKEEFPNDIMQDVYAKQVKDLEIGVFTQYLIGWRSELPEKYRQLLTDKKALF